MLLYSDCEDAHLRDGEQYTVKRRLGNAMRRGWDDRP
jgi:hypothetical protein